MVFIRRVRAASGATAVQIAEYVGGRQRVVKHVGSAHSPAELGVLMARARELLEAAGQDALDLGVEATPVVAPLLSMPSAQPDLFSASGLGTPARARAARVLSTDARVLFEALTGVYSGLGFDAVGDEVFRDLVIARVVEPTSVLDTARVLTDLRRTPASPDRGWSQAANRAFPCAVSRQMRPAASVRSRQAGNRTSRWCFSLALITVIIQASDLSSRAAWLADLRLSPPPSRTGSPCVRPAAGLSANTVRAYRADIAAVAAELAGPADDRDDRPAAERVTVDQLTPDAVVRALAALQRAGRSPATRARIHGTLAGLCAHLVHQGS